MQVPAMASRIMAKCQGYGLHASMVRWAESVGTVAAPLLAGFSLASVVVIAGDPHGFYWAGAAIVSLTLAAITLIAAVQGSKLVHQEEPDADPGPRGRVSQTTISFDVSR